MPLNNLIWACLEKGPSRIAGEKVCSLFCLFLRLLGFRNAIIQNFESNAFCSMFSSLLLFDRFVKKLTIYFSTQPTKSTEHPGKLRALNWVRKSELMVKLSGNFDLLPKLHKKVTKNTMNLQGKKIRSSNFQESLFSMNYIKG